MEDQNIIPYFTEDQNIIPITPPDLMLNLTLALITNFPGPKGLWAVVVALYTVYQYLESKYISVPV